MALDQLGDWQRTHTCGELRIGDKDTAVTLVGWVSNRRDHGGVIFIDLKDYTGLAQIVFGSQHSVKAFLKADVLRPEYVIAVQGTIAKRADNMINRKMATGRIEVYVYALKILNFCSNLPFQISDGRQDVTERTRLKYRTLDLRRSEMQKNLVLRSKAAHVVRNYFHNCGFLEIDTPFLTKSTPEGARDFLVPSRVNPGKFYALPQSPQLFKQILMISGYDRYFQIVKCFRDEDLRGNRQPEFTQIDMELSFGDQDTVMKVVEEMIAELFYQTIGHKVFLPIVRMTYDEAIEGYGSDAPDLRFGLTLKNISDIAKSCSFQVFNQAIQTGGIVKAILVPGGATFSRKELDNYTEFVKIYRSKGMAWAKIRRGNTWQSPIEKFFSPEEIARINQRTGAKNGDLLVFGADSAKIVNDSLGNLRKNIAQKRGLISKKEYRFVWVTDFPLLEYDEDQKCYHAFHHPFTMPDIVDVVAWEKKDPSRIRAMAYDLVLNGVELGGGSVRIHQKEMQERVFKLLNLKDEEINEKFGFFLDALEMGTPPHAGLALGFDRIMMFLSKAKSIRDVIPFPKTQQASCLLTEAPSDINNEQLKELGLSLKRTIQN